MQIYVFLSGLLLRIIDSLVININNKNFIQCRPAFASRRGTVEKIDRNLIKVKNIPLNNLI